MIENKSLGSKIFDALNVVFLVIVMLICIMPVWYVLCVSLSSREAVNAGKVAFWPVGFNLFSYQKILRRDPHRCTNGSSLQYALYKKKLSFFVLRSNVTSPLWFMPGSPP